MSIRERLNACGCCEGIGRLTPEDLYNRPGLDQLVYRVGTHARFKHSMLAQISTHTRLRALTTRQDDDAGIALIDAFAVVLDILSFYQERIANEGYLRSADERRSLLELARLIGYELAPGVAAGTYLAFTLDDKEGSPTEITIPRGTRAQSIPGQDELPQPFETSVDLVARPQWSALKPRLTHTQLFHSQTRVFYIEGVSNALSKGDQMLLVAQPGPDETSTLQQLVPLKVVAVESFSSTDQSTQWTKLTLDVNPPASGLSVAYLPIYPVAATFSYDSQPFTGSSVDAQLYGQTWSSGLLNAYTQVQGWPVSALGNYLYSNRSVVPSAEAADGLYALRTRASAFGHNAPRWSTIPEDWRLNPYTNDWDGIGPTDSDNGTPTPATAVIPAVNEDAMGNTHSASNTVYLDRDYGDVVEGSFVVVSGGTGPQVFTVGAVDAESRADFGLSAKASRLSLTEVADATPSDAAELANIPFRKATVHTQSESLELIELPIEDDVEGDSLELEQVELLLEPGRIVVVRGERSDLLGVIDSEAAVIREIQQVNGYTRLVFNESLTHAYIRNTTTIHANVAAATHGETRQQVLGSGDASIPFQRFDLKQSPLTYVSGTSASGAESTTEIRVDGVLWHQADSFYGLGPNDRCYVLRRDDDGNTAIQFGDGVHGARLPTGNENLSVTYRVGVGTDGHVDRDRITLLASPPLGVRGVNNHVEASGAEDPEQRDAARDNAPTTVKTLDRIVSLTDFEDYARTYGGIAKASADWVWDGTRRLIIVTVSGVDGTEVSNTLLDNLRNSMDAHRDPFQTMQLKRYQQRYFTVEAELKIHEDYIVDDVLRAAESAIRERFSFDCQQFAQGVHPSDVIAVLHAVSGVLGVDLNSLALVPADSGAPPVAPLDALPAVLTQDISGNDVIEGAQLLVITPEPLKLEEMT